VCGRAVRVMVVLWTTKPFRCGLYNHYAYYAIYLCLDDYHVYLSILYVYEIKCVVVPLYPCYIDVIMCIFTVYHTILSHGYTQLFRHPTFCKIVQLSSHMPPSVIFYDY
jgi:hypothetical protein